jgi:hypothetical protein
MARRGSEPDEREQTRIIENPIQCLQNQIAHNGFRKVGRTSVTVYNHLGLWDRRGEGGAIWVVWQQPSYTLGVLTQGYGSDLDFPIRTN